MNFTRRKLLKKAALASFIPVIAPLNTSAFRGKPVAKSAIDKNLSLLSGFCFRYHHSNRECMKRILDGQIGDISTAFNARLGGTLWSHPRKAEWSEAEYQLRNWIYYTWLSGDLIVEQAVHSIDLMSWAMGGKLPEYAIGTGGREVRTEQIYGNVYDHFAITYGYENGSKGIHFSRQQANCYGTNVLEIAGTKGNALIDVSKGTSAITGQTPWRFSGQANDMFQTEHDEFFASIRSGTPMNDGEWMAHSTLIAIMGRMAAYTGKKVTWEEAFNSRETLGPPAYGFDMKLPEVAVAKPGITAFY